MKILIKASWFISVLHILKEPGAKGPWALFILSLQVIVLIPMWRLNSGCAWSKMLDATQRQKIFVALVTGGKNHQLNTKLTVKTNWVKEAGFTGFKLTREWLTDLVILNVCFVCLFVRVLHANVMQSIMSHFALSDFELETQALLIILSPGCSVFFGKSFQTKIQ